MCCLELPLLPRLRRWAARAETVRSADRRHLSVLRRQRPAWVLTPRRRMRPHAEIINKSYDFELPLAKGEGLPGLGGAKIQAWCIADHQSRSAEGPRRSRAPDHPGQGRAPSIGTYQSAVAVTVSQICERYQIPFLSADNSSPSLHRRGSEIFLPRRRRMTRCSRRAMFDFFDAMKKKGTKIDTLSLFHEDTIFGTDSAMRAARKLAKRARLQGRRRHQVSRQLAVAVGRSAAAQGRQCRTC